MATGEKVRERLAKREKNSKKRKSLVQKQMRHLAKRYGFCSRKRSIVIWLPLRKPAWPSR